jgi:hypothetical protein
MGPIGLVIAPGRPGLMNKCLLICLLGALAAIPSLALCQEYCNSEEKPVFSCQIKDKKAELCYSKEINDFVYRFKKGDVVQFQYPKVVGGNDPFKFSSTPYAGGGEAHVRFENGDYTYFIYDKDVKNSDGGLNSTAGIIVKKGGKAVANMQCDNDASIHSEAYDIIPKESYEDIGAQ